MSDPVTVLVRRRVKPGQEAAYEAWLTRLTEGVARDFPGYLGQSFTGPALRKASIGASSALTICPRWSGLRRQIFAPGCWKRRPRSSPLTRSGSG